MGHSSVESIPTNLDTEETEEVFGGPVSAVTNFSSILSIANVLPKGFRSGEVDITVVLNPRSRQFTITGHDVVNKLDEENGNNVASYTIRNDGSISLDGRQKFKLDQTFNKYVTDQELHLQDLMYHPQFILGQAQVISEKGSWGTDLAEFKLKRK